MDEITLVSAVLVAAPPPHPEVTAQARQRLAERMSAPGLAAAPAAAERAAAGPAVRPTGPRRMPSRRVRWSAALAGVAAAGLAGALAVTTLPRGAGHGTAGPGGSGGLVTSEEVLAGVGTGQPARPYLTALATRVAQASAGTGKYWCQGLTMGQLDPIGPGGQELTPPGQGETPSPVSDYRYSIFARHKAYDCFEYTRTGRHNVGGWLQDLGGQPATARDAAAWHRDGSPEWHAWYGNDQLIPSRPDRRYYMSGKRGTGPGIPSLPAGPAKLRKALLAMIAAPPSNLYSSSHEIKPAGMSRAEFQHYLLYQTALGQLQEPVSPAVRAALYQVMANIPGVHAEPGVADPSGRAGTALWFGSLSRWGSIEIVDPQTGEFLAAETLATAPHGVYAPGTLLQYDLLQPPGWTNRVPRG